MGFGQARDRGPRKRRRQPGDESRKAKPGEAERFSLAEFADAEVAAKVERIGGAIAHLQTSLREASWREDWRSGLSPPLYGTAVLSKDDREIPAILVQLFRLENWDPDDALSAPLVPASEAREVAAFLEAAELEDDLEGTYVFGVDAPTPLFASGQSVTGPAGTVGTLGARVLDAKGDPSILTAGHVAVAGSLVRDDGDQPGLVSFSIDPGQVPSADQAVADVGVISPLIDNGFASGLSLGAVSTPKPGAAVTIHGAVSGERDSTVMGASDWIHVPTMGGSWADVYLLSPGVSAPGDSGSPVTLADTGALIGHVVGGSGLVLTYVQSIELQLRVTSTRLYALQ